MAFCPTQNWVWDFWIADDGERYHLYYLNAPKALGHPDARHRMARIGHASSTDLRHWTEHGQIFDTGQEDAFDATATWTGCVVCGDDGLWRMFYTGARFLFADGLANIETVGLATSADLHVWTKQPGPVVSADPQWYETLGSSSWPEEAWRDPWVFRAEDGLWHMLITARDWHDKAIDRGVVGHATSADLQTWTVGPPLSRAGSGFAHLEVLQIAEIAGSNHLIFSCDGSKLAGRRAGRTGGIWTVPLQSPERIETSAARLLLPESHYSGRLVNDRHGRPQLLAVLQNGGDVRGLSDPMAVTVGADGYLQVEENR